MILVDTSVWIDHLAKEDAALQALLKEGRVLAHPFVIGEVVSALHALPEIPVASSSEAMALLNVERPFEMGIGYVDLHLLASTRLMPTARLWTRDKRLLGVAMQLNLAAFVSH